MLPFCGYNMADYFGHWLNIGQEAFQDKLPRIYYVNWFRKNSNGAWLWPGFGENSRVLKWIFGRVSHDPEAKAVKTPIGYLPTLDSIDMSGLHLSEETTSALFEVNREEWTAEVQEMRAYLKQFEDRLPQGIIEELDGLEERLQQCKHTMSND